MHSRDKTSTCSTLGTQVTSLEHFKAFAARTRYIPSDTV
jgi:hypothetical protein